MIVRKNISLSDKHNQILLQKCKELRVSNSRLIQMLIESLDKQEGSKNGKEQRT